MRVQQVSGALSLIEIDEVRKQVANLNLAYGKIGHGRGRLDFRARASEVAFLEGGHFLGLRAHDILETLSRKCSKLSRPQYSIYRQGQYYSWHQDDPIGRLRRPADAGRRWAVLFQLTDPDQYSGGDFEICHEGPPTEGAGETDLIWREQGSALVFSTQLFHRVTVVTRGARESIVVWGY